MLNNSSAKVVEARNSTWKAESSDDVKYLNPFAKVQVLRPKPGS